MISSGYFATKEELKALADAQAKIAAPNTSKFALASDVKEIQTTLATPILKQVISSGYFATKEELKALVDAQAKIAAPNTSKFALATDVQALRDAQAKMTAPNTSKFALASDVKQIQTMLETPILKQMISSGYFASQESVKANFATKQELKALVDAQAKIAAPNTSKFALAADVKQIQTMLATQFVKETAITDRINPLITKALGPITARIQNLSNIVSSLQRTGKQKGGLHNRGTRKNKA